jgi:hypothetical protein
MSMSKAFILLCLCSACGGSTPAGGGGTTLTFDLDGTAMDLSNAAGATASNAPYLTDVAGHDSEDSNYLTIELSVAPPVAGTYSCPTDGVGIIYSPSGSAGFYAGSNSSALTGSTQTSCTITVTSYTASGQPFEGTFSGTLAKANSPGVTHVITNGHFKMNAP